MQLSSPLVELFSCDLFKKSWLWSLLLRPRLNQLSYSICWFLCCLMNLLTSCCWVELYEDQFLFIFQTHWIFNKVPVLAFFIILLYVWRVSWLTEVYCIMFTTQLVYISSPLHLTLKDHCTNWRTLNKGSGQNLWPFKFFISIFVVLVLLFSLTFYNFHGQNYLNALKISIYGTVNNDELAWSSVPQLSEKVFIHPG